MLNSNFSFKTTSKMLSTIEFQIKIAMMVMKRNQKERLLLKSLVLMKIKI
jgi:hypothetical protein